MNFKIWDKKESINGVDAETILENRNDIRNEENVILIYNEGIVTNIELCSTLKSIYNFDSNLTVEEVANNYLKLLEENKQNITNNDLEERVTYLEDYVLENETAKIKDNL